MNTVGKIALWITLAATCAAAFLSYQLYGTRERITSKVSNLESQNGKLRGDLRDREEALTTATNQLAQTSNQLVQASSELGTTRQQIEKLTADLTGAQDELASTKTALAERQSALDAMEGRIRGLEGELTQREVTMEEVQAELRRFREEAMASGASLTPIAVEDPGSGPPRGLKGRILIVNDRWSFVVLNVGRQQGVRAGVELMVHRDGQLIGRVKIREADEIVSVADVLSQWRLGEIAEGDQVLY